MELHVLMSEDEEQKLKNEIHNNWDIHFYRFSAARQDNVEIFLKKVKVEDVMDSDNKRSSTLVMHSLLFLTICLIYIHFSNM